MFPEFIPGFIPRTRLRRGARSGTSARGRLQVSKGNSAAVAVARPWQASSRCDAQGGRRPARPVPCRTATMRTGVVLGLRPPAGNTLPTAPLSPEQAVPTLMRPSRHQSRKQSGMPPRITWPSPKGCRPSQVLRRVGHLRSLKSCPSLSAPEHRSASMHPAALP